MSRLVLNEEQMQIVKDLKVPVDVYDPCGRALGTLEPLFTPEQIAELKRIARSPGPRYSGKQVQARLKAFEEEWERTGGFDEKYGMEFMAKLNAADPGKWHVGS